MARKGKIVRALDIVPQQQTLAPAPDESVDDLAPPLPPSAFAPPTNLVLTPALARSASTPTTLIVATWDAPSGIVVEKYSVQWSTNNAFPAASTASMDTFRDGGTIEHRRFSDIVELIPNVATLVTSAG